MKRKGLNAYEKRLLVWLGDECHTPVSACAGPHLDHLLELDMAEIVRGEVALTWAGICKLRELRR